ncbi:ribosomal protein S1 [Pseudomonas sp. JAI111]|nr:ribosomal protein S1 [Pseudomonas sp. JAI111]
MDSEIEKPSSEIEPVAKKAKASGADFGIFIGMQTGIDGLVHLSDLEWNETGEEVVRSFKKADVKPVNGLSIDEQQPCDSKDKI